jgi:sporulation protein YlmC with PRC-barrel domain
MKSANKILIGLGVSAFAFAIAVKYIDLRSRYYIIMNDAKVGIKDVVTFNGVQIGEVKNLDLRNDYKVVIEVRINQNVRIPKSSRVLYKKGDGLLSNISLEIEGNDTKNEFYSNLDSIIGSSDLPENIAEKEIKVFLNKITKISKILQLDSSIQENVKNTKSIR